MRKSVQIKKILVAVLFLGTMFMSVAQTIALSPEQRRFLLGGARYYDVNVGCASATANGNIYFLGDSLTVGMRDEGGLTEKFEAKGWTNIKIQATDGDNIEKALPKVDADQEDISKASTAVIGLGTNRDGDFAARVDELVTKIRSYNEEIKIYWINVYTAPGAYLDGGTTQNNQYNTILTDQSVRLGFFVLNWSGVAGIRESENDGGEARYPFTPDGVHHTAEGYQARVDWLVNEVGVPPAALPGADSSAGSATELVGESNEEKIFNYLLGKQVAGQPLKDFHVAGILGNMWAESRYRPQRLQGTGVDDITTADQARGSSLGWGLVQWTPAGKMINPLMDAGIDPNDMKNQLDFLLEQLNNRTPIPEGPAGEHLINTRDVGAATLSFETQYERHKGPPQPERIVEAQRILDEGFTGAGGGCGGGTTDLSSTVLKYAWPEYHDAPYPQKKPEYETLVQEADANGLYVGGNPGQYLGVDCGGWVTQLMLESGWEPNYNFAGVIADGASNVSGGQYPWVRDNWEKITVSGTQDLRPGDVAINTGRSHTFAWVGEIENFEYEVASASYGKWRAPMAGKENPLDSDIEWYRKK